MNSLIFFTKTYLGEKYDHGSAIAFSPKNLTSMGNSPVLIKLLIQSLTDLSVVMHKAQGKSRKQSMP